MTIVIFVLGFIIILSGLGEIIIKLFELYIMCELCYKVYLFI